jgi:phage tail-like protein
MVADDSKQSGNVWPLPLFYFKVNWGTEVMRFQEMSGLQAEAQPIEYRAGEGPTFARIKLPDSKKYSNVTLKKGVIKSDSRLWDWFNQLIGKTIKRETITISLLDEAGAPTLVWTLANAWPTRITGTDLKVEGNEVAVEAIEIAYESLTIQNA